MANGQEELLSEAITLSQLWLATALPTIFSLGSLTVAAIGVMTANGRLNTIDARLLAIEKALGDLRERVTRMEMQHH